MLKGVLEAVLRVLAGTLFVLALAATIGIPEGRSGPSAAQPGDDGAGPSPACAGLFRAYGCTPNGRRPLVKGEG